MGCQVCGTQAPRFCNNCHKPDTKTTVRFWFQSTAAGEALAAKLKSYGAKYIPINNDINLAVSNRYSTYAGRVLMVLDELTAKADFIKIVLTAQDSGAYIGELLVDDLWETVKPVIRGKSS